MAVTTVRGGSGGQIKAGSIAKADTDTSIIAADGTRAFSGDQSLGGFKVTNLGTPSGATDAATKGYVDGVASGLSVHEPVRAATTGNITLSGAQTIDGVSVIAGDRVLVKAQTAGADNGIYVAAAGAWARAADMDTSAEAVSGTFTFVSEGTVNADSGWVLTTDAPVTLGTTSLVFAQFSGAGQITAGAGLTKSGNTLTVGAGTGITVNADDVAISAGGVGVTELAAAVAGAGLTGGAGSALAVGAGTGITVNANDVQIADGGVGVTQLAAAVAGAGLTGGAGSALAVGAGDGISVAADSVTVNLDGSSLSKSSSGLKVNPAKFITRETPTGSVNGSNTSFALANTPVTGTEHVYLNGLLQEPGAGNDYTISGATITYLTAPVTGDKIRVSYIIA